MRRQATERHLEDGGIYRKRWWASLAKAERAAYWKGELTNTHIPDVLDAIWRWDPGESPFH